MDGLQIELVEEQTGNMDPKTNFRLILYQTELERFKFLVRSLLRARIAKVSSFAFFWLRFSPPFPPFAARGWTDKKKTSVRRIWTSDESSMR